MPLQTPANERPPLFPYTTLFRSAPAEYAPDSVTLSKGTSFGDPISAMAAADESGGYRVGTVVTEVEQKTSVQITKTVPTNLASQLNVVEARSYSSLVTKSPLVYH